MKRISLGKVSMNALWIIGSKLIKAVLTMIVTMLIARYLGPDNYGLINYASSVVMFVAPVMKLGIDAVMVYEFVQNKEDEGKIIGTSFILNVTSAILCIVGVLAFVSVVNRNEPVTVIVCALYSSLLIFQAFEMIQYWFQAKLLSKYVAVTMLFSYICISAFQIFLLATGKSVYWFAVISSLDYLIISVVLITIYRRLNGQPFEFSFGVARRLLSKGKYYIVSSLMVTVFQQTDRIMLKLMCDNTAVGYYSAALTCATMFAFVFAAIIDSYRSTIFECKKISQGEFEKNLRLVYGIIIYGSLAVSLGMSVFSGLIVRIMYGSQYGAAVPVLQILVWFNTFSYIGTIRDIWILSEGHQKYMFLINFLGAMVNFVTNLIAIPVLGAVGAALTSLFTQIFTNFILCYLLKPIRPCGRIMLQSLNLKTVLASMK